MATELILKSGWIRLEKPELDKLRRLMRQQYESEGGMKNFNSHLPNYEELREFIRAKISEIKSKNDIRITILGQTVFDIVPGNTFFKDFFYTKKDVDHAQFQEYNIDVCYLYLFGKSRFEQKRAEKSHYTDAIPSGPVGQNEMKIIISSTMNNMSEAEKLKNFLVEKTSIPVESEIRNSHVYSRGSLNELYQSLDANTYILKLISRDYLQNERCVKELIDYTANNLENYLKHTFHILLSDIHSGDFNIFDSLGRSELIKYWLLRIEKLEENHKLLMTARKNQEFYERLRKELDDIKGIIEGLDRLIDLIRENEYSVNYEILINRITDLDSLVRLLPKQERIHPIDDKLETTYKRIKIPSNNDPKRPEFPPEPFYIPQFPASGTYKIQIPGFTNVWLKDESTNPTGTHKDRMAWEVVIKYKSLIEALKYKSQDKLPQMSIISSGSAAIAIQHLFNLFRIPTSLKVLCDYRLNPKIKESVRKVGCELYECNLSEKLLSSDEIKELTNNQNGIDITYREVLDPTHDNYYDWLSYEIIMEKPEYCFIPFGTGDLFINVLNIVKVEHFYSFVSKHDPRFFGDIASLKKCNFMGAASDNPNTRLDKLYSSFHPSLSSYTRYIQELKEEYSCVGNLTDIYYVSEEFVGQAIELGNRLGIRFEPSGVAGLALLLQIKESVPRHSKILIVNTGRTKDINELET